MNTEINPSVDTQWKSKACIFIDVPSAIFNVVYHKIVTYKMKSDKPNKVREVGGKSQGCGVAYDMFGTDAKC